MGEYVFAYLTDEQGPAHSNSPPSTSGDQGAGNSNYNPPSSPGDVISISETPRSTKSSNSESSKSKISNAPVLITLSDSDPDCVDNGSCSAAIDLNCSNSSDDMQTLADRIGLTKTLSIPSDHSKSGSDEFRHRSPSSMSRSHGESENVYNKTGGSVDHTPCRGLTPGEGVILTPSQRAGMAALKRQESEFLKRRVDQHLSSIHLAQRREVKRASNGTQATHDTEGERFGESKVGGIVSTQSSRPLTPTGKSQSSATLRLSASISGTKGLSSKAHSSAIVVDLTESDAITVKDCSVERSKVNEPPCLDEESKEREGNEVDLSCPEFVLRPGQ